MEETTRTTKWRESFYFQIGLSFRTWIVFIFWPKHDTQTLTPNKWTEHEVNFLAILEKTEHFWYVYLYKYRDTDFLGFDPLNRVLNKTVQQTLSMYYRNSNNKEKKKTSINDRWMKPECALISQHCREERIFFILAH